MPLVQELTAKERCENWFLAYGLFWISCFAVIIACGIYENMNKWHYLLVTGGLAAPLCLQPFFLPSLTGEKDLPLLERHCTKANVWIAIYSFLGTSTSFFCVQVCVMAYCTAFLETFSISAFPYYTFDDRQQMYTVGSAFYALYLAVSFPMFARLDWKPGTGCCLLVALW
ncbi:CPI1 [Symbiodinium necroappetens]|uniref:CPI1 protein n=1 Tax=Symbiodinium necroappetens TaxID=1628268 RepID=A0A812NAP5_9DINO|nr:CPI1 [Symbiodinium necroappetens]